MFEVPTLRTLAETDADSVATAEVDDNYPLRFRRRGATKSRVTEIDDQT